MQVEIKFNRKVQAVLIGAGLLLFAACVASSVDPEHVTMLNVLKIIITFASMMGGIFSMVYSIVDYLSSLKE